MVQDENYHLTPEQIKERDFKLRHFREITEFDKKNARIPRFLWDLNKDDVLPEHMELIKNYVLSFTVGREYKNPSHGIIFYGDNVISMNYMSIILQRVYMRKRTIYCGSVYNLEEDCKNYERMEFLSENVSLLSVYGFPFFLNGKIEGRNDLLLTMFHRMLLNRRDNMLPTIFVSEAGPEKLMVDYSAFPVYMRSYFREFNTLVEVKRQQT